MIRVLDIEELALRWAEIQPYIQKAVDHGIGESSAHDLFMECMEGWAHCWESDDPKAFAITRYNKFSQHEQIQIVTCAGDGWQDYGPEALEMIEQYAREVGCKYVSIWGRKGWECVLPDGWKHTYAVYTKEI